jgi:6-pyruvoyltetrahydropterin 2'-reductase
MKETIPIAEIFYSLQGEGEKVGYPSIFIRTALCNLTCRGFNCIVEKNGKQIRGCDTIRAVNPAFKDEWNNMTSEDIISSVNSYIPINSYDKPIIVVTGGEPLIHQNNVLYSVIQYYISRGYQVQFESNGTLDIDFVKYPLYKKCQFALSVKLSIAGGQESIRVKPDVINNILSNTNNSFFKFVIRNEYDITEVDYILQKVPTYAPVYLMPMGGNKNDLNTNAERVFQFCVEKGFRYSDRIHIRIYNDKEKV